MDIEKLLAESDARKATAAKSVAKTGDAVVLMLTKTEAQCLAEIFSSCLAGGGLYTEGTPLNDLYYKVGAVREEVGTTHHITNDNEVTHTDRQWLPNLKRWSERRHFGKAYAILRYWGPKR